jgi:hypothetical protein
MRSSLLIADELENLIINRTEFPFRYYCIRDRRISQRQRRARHPTTRRGRTHCVQGEDRGQRLSNHYSYPFPLSRFVPIYPSSLHHHFRFAHHVQAAPARSPGEAGVMSVGFALSSLSTFAAPPNNSYSSPSAPATASGAVDLVVKVNLSPSSFRFSLFVVLHMRVITLSRSFRPSIHRPIDSVPATAVPF